MHEHPAGTVGALLIAAVLGAVIKGLLDSWVAKSHRRVRRLVRDEIETRIHSHMGAFHGKDEH